MIFRITNNLEAIGQELGYCPQDDPLDPMLTGEEMIYFYARLRGIPEEYIKQVCDFILTNSSFNKHLIKRLSMVMN